MVFLSFFELKLKRFRISLALHQLVHVNIYCFDRIYTYNIHIYRSFTIARYLTFVALVFIALALHLRYICSFMFVSFRFFFNYNYKFALWNNTI